MQDLFVHQSCVFFSFLNYNGVVVYGSIAVQCVLAPSVLDLKFQAGVGWDFRNACGDEVGIQYEFVDQSGIAQRVNFEEGVAAEKKGLTLITMARVTSARQMRAIASGETIYFKRGRDDISVRLSQDDVLYAAEILASEVTLTVDILRRRHYH